MKERTHFSLVIYSDIRTGPIGSTFSGSSSSGGSSGGSGTSAKPTSTSTSAASSSTGAAHYAQCGGTGWTGATTWYVSSDDWQSHHSRYSYSVSPYTCTVLNQYYSQCL